MVVSGAKCMGTGSTPFLVGLPLEFLLQGRGHAPAVGETELSEHRTGSGQAEVLDEILPQEPHRDRVEQEGALPGEPNDASLRVEFQEFFVM